MFVQFLRKRQKIKPILNYFCFALVKHCNLNCKYCDHFSPLAEKKYADINVLKKDFIRISKLVDVKNIGIMGGEPLLHPNINLFIKVIREIFKNSKINIYTNGILLENKEDSFWEACFNYKIGIVITKYPLKLNFKTIINKAKNKNIPISLYVTEGENCRKMYKMALDLDGTQDALKMHKICWNNKGSCIYFENGKFFQCSIVGNIHNFNDYFKTNLIVSDKDYIDIYKIKKGEEIIKFLKKPIPFCKYCNINKREYGIPFSVSKKEITEWSYINESSCD